MKTGDFVVLAGANGSVEYGEVVGETSSGIEVYFIEKKNNNVWCYSETWHEVARERILNTIKTAQYTSVVTALHALGFRPLSDSTFARVDEEGETPIGDSAFDDVDDNTDEDIIDPEMQDFIVPDEEGERFTFAEPNNEFVRSTHKAVHDFNRWHPEGEATRVKNYILNLEERVSAQEHRRTRLGEALNYNKPPR